MWKRGKAFNYVKFHVARAFANREYEAAEEARKIVSRDRGGRRGRPWARVR